MNESKVFTHYSGDVTVAHIVTAPELATWLEQQIGQAQDMTPEAMAQHIANNLLMAHTVVRLIPR